MAPDVNWDLISKIANGSVQFDGSETTEEEIDMLRDVDESKFQDDSEKLTLLIQSLKKAFEFREVALNDILQDHDAEIEELKQELEEERKQGGGVPRDAEYYRIENRRLLEEKNSYQQQNDDLNRELAKVSDDQVKLEQELESSRKLIRDLRAETQDLRLNLRDYQSIIDKQNIQRVASGGDSELQDKLNERNKQISELLTQIMELEKSNRDLEDGARKLRQEMELGREEMNKMADEYEKMRGTIGTTDKFSDDLQKQNAQLKLQVADLRNDLDSRKNEDDMITTALNEKVEEWNNRFREQNQVIEDHKRTVAQLKSKIASAGWDRDKLNVEKLTKKHDASRNEVTKLKAALTQAVEDLEEQTAIVEDLRRDQGTNREVISYKKQIRTLQDQIKELEVAAKTAESRRNAAEIDAQENDAKLTEALRRVGLLESGQYGLTEAVNEIKECKDLIRSRDREIRELTQVTNKLEEKLNDFIEENEEFRERLDLNPRNLDDIVELRKKRTIRQQQFRAENQILLKEIESLEEERIQLKKQIRLQAQSQIQKASDQGLAQEDIALIEEFVDEVIHMRRTTTPDKKLVVCGSLAAVYRSDPSRPKKLDNTDTKRLEKLLDDEKIENRALERELDEAKSENQSFKVALQDVAREIKNPKNVKQSIKIPSLNKLVDLLQGKRPEKYESGANQSEFDELRGRNDELRNELKRVRAELVNFSSKNQRQPHNSEFVTRGKRYHLAMLSLSSDVNPKSDDVINALNEQLIEVLSDSEKKTSKLSELKEVLENSRRQLQVLRHQTHTLYKEHHVSLEEREQEKKNWEKEKDQMQEKLDGSEVKLDEYDRLLSALESDPDEAKRKMAEASRKASLLRFNEKKLIRRYKTLEAAEDLLRAENQRLRNEIGSMEKSVSEKISYLERYKSMAAFKLESLQKAVENTVPESDLFNLNRKFDELTVKYRDLLQQENQMVTINAKMETMKEELKISLENSEVLRGELSIEKEKRISLEQAIERSNITLVPTESDSLMKRVSFVSKENFKERSVS